MSAVSAISARIIIYICKLTFVFTAMNRLICLVTTFLVLLSPRVSADTPAADDPASRLMRYAGNIYQFNSIYPQEKVYIQFDNTSYYNGETIWFKAFVVNAATLKQSQSKVLYVDLLSPDGVLLKQQKLPIIGGQADGAFQLTDDAATAQSINLRGILDYPSGFYEIRAYTKYMQNFGQDAIFSRVMAVFDKPKREGRFYDEKPTITIKDQVDIMPVRPETPKQKKVNVSFYPEGGHIIIGQPCRVAFKVTDNNGLGMDATGSMGNNITFTTQHNGMGSFTFTPQSRNNSVSITANGHSHSFSIQDAEETGCTVQAAMLEEDKIEFKIFSSADIINEELGMTLTCRGQLVDFAQAVINESETLQTFDMSYYPEGVIRFTLFNKDGNILATRSFYHERSDVKSPSISVSSVKTSYAPFEKVTLDFMLTNSKGEPYRNRFCLSVRDTRSPASNYQDDLRTNLLLASDLKGFIEGPDYYFNTSNQERQTHLDLLCMVQGWERYDWRIMAGVDSFEEKFRIEDQGLTINGWVLNGNRREPLSNVEVNATIIPGDKKLTESYTYTTQENGYFGFDIGVAFYNKARFTIMAAPLERKMRKGAVSIMFDRAVTPTIRPYLPGETAFMTKEIKSVPMPESAPAADDSLHKVINENIGIILPDVVIDEDRKFVDYFTFQAYDVVKDVEKERDKGNYSTDLLGYLTELGYNVQIGYMADSLPEINRRGATQFDNKLLINGKYAYIYAHTENAFVDLEIESREMGGFDDPSIVGALIDTRSIKSIMVYNHPMIQTDAWALAPLYLSQCTHVFKILPPPFPVESDSFYEACLQLQKREVYMIDVLLKNPTSVTSKQEELDRSRRYTTVDGFSAPYSFYSPEYPNGPIPGDVDSRRTLYWDPNVITDTEGKAQVEFYNNSNTSHFNISAAGISAAGLPFTLNEDW